MNVFEIASKDQSVYILGQIFGYVGSVLPTAGGSLLLGTLFKTFNTIALTVGVSIIVYTTIVGLLATAHEGEFLGKKWSGLWVPMRMLLGVIALFPTATGYSALQVAMMWVILQGIGAADALWNTTINYVQFAGSPYSTITQNTPDSNLNPMTVKSNMKVLFQGLVCQATSGNSADEESYCGKNASDEFCSRSQDQRQDILTGPQAIGDNVPDSVNRFYSMGPGPVGTTGGACGLATFGDARKVCAAGSTDPQGMIKCAVYEAQQKALQTIVTTLGSIANSFASYDYNYRQFYDGKQTPTWMKSYCAANKIPDNQCCVDALGDVYAATGLKVPTTCRPRGQWELPNYMRPDKSVDTRNAGQGLINKIIWPYGFANLSGSDFIKSSADFYIANVTGAIISAISQLAPSVAKGWDEERANGWIFAGAYYYKLAQKQDSLLDQYVPKFSISGGGGQTIPNTPVSYYRNNYLAAQTLIDASAPPPTSTFAMSMPPAMTTLTNDLSSTANSLFKSWMISLTGSTGETQKNPLAEVQSFGKTLLTTAEVLFSIFIAGGFIAIWVSNISVFAFGTGAITGFGAAMLFLYMVLMPMIFALLLALYVLGGTLAVYVPLIPFIVFTMAALGWVMAVIEAMIAAPIVAIGMLSPGGHHEIFGRAEAALMLILNIFLLAAISVSACSSSPRIFLHCR